MPSRTCFGSRATPGSLTPGLPHSRTPCLPTSHLPPPTTVPTLAADETLQACLESLASQAFRDFEVIVVDNSGRQLAEPQEGVRIINNGQNVGFGAAVNQGIRASQGTFVATLNEDAAAAEPGWLEALVRAIGERPVPPSQKLRRAGTACDGPGPTAPLDHFAVA